MADASAATSASPVLCAMRASACTSGVPYETRASTAISSDRNGSGAWSAETRSARSKVNELFTLAES